MTTLISRNNGNEGNIPSAVSSLKNPFELKTIIAFDPVRIFAIGKICIRETRVAGRRRYTV